MRKIIQKIQKIRELIASQRKRSTDTQESLPSQLHGVTAKEEDSNLSLDVGLELEYGLNNEWRYYV